MRRGLGLRNLFGALAIFTLACQPAQPGPAPAKDAPTAAPAAKQPAAQGVSPTRVVIGATETIESPSPYAHIDPVKFGIWCEVYGCLIRQDWEKGGYGGQLAESWKVENPTTWAFSLRKGVEWQDGSPLTAGDVVHSFERIMNDPATPQKQLIQPIARVEAVGDETFKIITKEPTATLLNFIKDIAITNKALYGQYGDNVYKDKPVGAGPYMFKELVPDQHVTIVKNPNWWAGPVQGPDEVVFRVMRETEVRVAALLNNEVQIAQYIPPHMAERVTSNSTTRIVPFDAIEGMFLAMRPDSPPFDNKLVRQAVAYAVDRDAIIKNVLQGYAERLDGPIGQSRYGYNPDLRPKYTYDPEKAKQLLTQAGYPNGVDVELSTPVGRYTQDKQISEAAAHMLTTVGIRTKLVTPEWATLWDNVMKGRVPFYYMGRLIFDPDDLRTYFETGVTPRIGYSNPKFDELLRKQRSTFDPEERQKTIFELTNLLTEEAPAHFMWRHKILTGMARSVEFPQRPDDRLFANDIRVR